MLQHIIGSAVGALVAWAVLILTNANNSSTYLTAVAIGAIASMLWPWVIGLFLARRIRQRRQDQIQQEVDKQISQQNQ
jgi:hypothetical protein